MEKKKTNVWEIILSLVVLLFLICFVLIFFQELGKIIVKGLDKITQIASKTDAVIIVTMITGSISLITVIISSIISKIIEFKQTTKRYLYEKREQPYSEFISMVYKIQKKAKEGEMYSEKELTKDLNEFSEKLTLWGSNKVIKKWLKFRKLSQQGEKINNLFTLEEIIYEIRKDMGQKKHTLQKGDILSFFVNDIEKYK